MLAIECPNAALAVIISASKVKVKAGRAASVVHSVNIDIDRAE
jgi:hypothetical protein